MKVIDLNGCPIEVTNLNEAIRITKRYKKYRHENESYSDYDKKQNAYCGKTGEFDHLIPE